MKRERKPPKVRMLQPRVQTLNTSVGTRLETPTPTFGSGRGGRPWRRLREKVLERDQFMCQCPDCKGERFAADEVDHITPVTLGGTDDMANLRAMNRVCHQSKSERERIEALRRNAPRGFA